MICNFRNVANQWQISESIEVVLCIFTLALTISDFDLQNVGQGHQVQSSQ